MRYLTIPHPMATAGKSYGLREFVDEVFVGHPSWRESADKLGLLEATLEKLDASDYLPGAIVELTDAEHEAGTPVVTVAGVQLAPHAARAVNRIARAWLGAPTKDPRPKPAEATAGSNGGTAAQPGDTP